MTARNTLKINQLLCFRVMQGGKKLQSMAIKVLVSGKLINKFTKNVNETLIETSLFDKNSHDN